MPDNLPASGAIPAEITPELVQKIADKVYAMWRKEWQIENERRRAMAQKNVTRRIK